MKTLLRGLSVAVVMLLSLFALAGDLTAEQIADRIVRDGAFQWEGAQTRLRMVLIDGGNKKERLLDVIGRRHGKETATVVRFREPADVAGTAFLMRQDAKGEPEQHLYLPGLKRTRRIVGRDREGGFMGSDFTYADMQRADVKDATHRKLPDETLDKDQVYVLESTPKAGNAPYSKVVTWVRKKDFVPLRTKFFGKDGRLVKTLYTLKIKDVDGRPVVVESRMQSESGHATLLVVESLQKRDDLPDSEFSPSALPR